MDNISHYYIIQPGDLTGETAAGPYNLLEANFRRGENGIVITAAQMRKLRGWKNAWDEYFAGRPADLSEPGQSAAHQFLDHCISWLASHPGRRSFAQGEIETMLKSAYEAVIGKTGR